MVLVWHPMHPLWVLWGVQRELGLAITLTATNSSVVELRAVELKKAEQLEDIRLVLKFSIFFGFAAPIPAHDKPLQL